MPVTLTKHAKPVPAAKPVVQEVEVIEPEKLSLEQLVDAYGSLKDRTEAILAQPVFTQFGLVEKELKTRLETYEPDEIVQVTGKAFLLEAGACKLEQRKVIDVMKIMTWLGSETFAKIAKVNVSDAEKYLNPDQCAEVLSVPGFTKVRSLTVKYLGGK